MNHVHEKPWSPLRFDVFPDDAGHATGFLYEDDGETLRYQQGLFRRTNVNYTTNATRVHLMLDAPVGNFQSPTRNLEFVLHTTPNVSVVLIDGQPLAHVDSSASSPGWFRDVSGNVILRIADDSHAHSLELH